MRLSFKAIIGIWVGIFLILAGLFYSAHSRLKPDTLIGLLTEQVQKNYPGASLAVGSVDYRLSLDFNLNLKNVQLSRSGKMLGSIGEIELKVPWWLLLVNKGNAQINLSNLQVFIDNDEPDLIKPTGDSANPSKSIKVQLPSFLAEAKYTLRAKNITIRDTKVSRRYLTLSKLLVREFQYGKNSAFELNIPVELNHKDSHYNSELWLFGDLTPSPEIWKMNYRGEFKGPEGSGKYEIENLIVDGKAEFRPTAFDFTTDVNLFIEKKSIGHGRLAATNNDIHLNVNFSALPLDFLTIFEAEIQNPYLSSFTSTAKGEVKITKKRGADIAFLNGKLAFDGSFPISEAEAIPGQWQISFEDSRWETSFLSPQGEITYFRRSVIDFKKAVMTQYTEELGFSEIECAKALPAVKSVSDLVLLSRPYFTSSVFLKNCKHESSLMTGSFKYGVTPDEKFYQATLSNERGTFNLNFQNKISINSLSIQSQNFKFNNSFRFLAPYLNLESGIVDMKLEGRWLQDWTDGDWTLQSRFQDLVRSEGKLFSLMTKILQPIDLEATPSLGFNAQIRKQALEISSMILEGQNPAKITGTLKLSPEAKSFLVITYPKNKKFKPLKKDGLQVNWKE